MARLIRRRRPLWWGGLGRFAAPGGPPPTWNLADTSPFIALTNNNLTATAQSGASAAGIRATRGYSASKVFWEINVGTGTWGADTGYGLSNAGASFSGLANTAAGGVLCVNTNLWLNGASAHVGGCPGNGAQNITVMVAVDLAAQLWWAQASNNANQWNVASGVGSASPAAGTGGWSFAGLNPILYPTVTFTTSIDMPFTLNAVGPFVLTPPAGFVALGTL